MADPHMRVVGPFDLQPPLDPFRRPPFLSASMTHSSSGSYAMRMGLRGWRMRLGLPLRGHRRVERTGRPRARLQPFRPVGPVGLVLVGREPRAASRLAADGGLVAADPQRDLAHAEPLAVPQLVDPDAFLCRQVGIGFHIECNAFSSVVDLNTSNHRQALHFYLEPGDVEKLVEYAVHQALCGCLFILVENILPGKRSSLTPPTTQRRNPTHENSNSTIIYVFQPNLSPVLTFYNQNKVHWATFSNFGV